MPRGEADLLQLLANPTNRAILTVLAIEPQYPRRLADLVGLTEDEASRRLRAFEKLGLAEAEWANLGKTVRLYRLATARFTVQVTSSGLTVAGGDAESPLRVEGARESPPELKRFVGRAAELAQLTTLLGARRAVCVHGIGGAGKTTLAIAASERWDGPVVWHTVAPNESGNLLLARLAANLSAIETGERAHRLLALRSGEEGSLLLSAIVETAEANRALLVLDRLEGAGEGAGDVLAGLARGLRAGALLVTSRAFPKDAPRDALAGLRLEGLGRDDAAALLRDLGAAVDDAALDAIYARTRGHPLALVLAALARPGGPVTPEDVAEDEGIRGFLLSDVLPQLPQTEREALLALCVLRTPFTADEAEAVTGSRHARDTLLRLEARGLVWRQGGSFALHDLVRTHGYEAVPERKLVHARAAKALKASGESHKMLEALHHHVEAGQLAEAGRIVREEAVRRAYRFPDQGLGAPYLAELARLESTRDVPRAEAAAVALELAIFDTRRWDTAAAHRRVEAAARALGGRDDELAVVLALARARLHHLEGRRAEAGEQYRQATRLARQRGDATMTLRCLVDHGFCEEEWSQPDAFAVYLEAVEVAQEASDPRLASLAYGSAARMAFHLKDPRGRVFADEALRLSRLSGDARGEAGVHFAMAIEGIVTGQSGATWESAERYLHIADMLGDPWLKACVLDEIAFLLIASGQHERAVKEAREALAFAQRIQAPFYEFAAAIALAEASTPLGRGEDAVAALAPRVDAAEGPWPALAARGWRALVAAHDAAGRADAAREARARLKRLDALLDAEGQRAKGDAGAPGAQPGWMLHPPGGLNP